MSWPTPPAFRERIIPQSSADSTRADREEYARAERETRAQRHERFAREYVIDLDRARAARAAGYHPEQADKYGALLLNRVEVKRIVRKLLAQRNSRLEVKADHVVEEVRRQAFSNILDYMKVDEDGRYLVSDFSKLTREQASAIAEVVVEEYQEGRGDEARDVKRLKFKLADKLKAAELLAKLCAFFPDHGQGQNKGEPTTIVQINTNVQFGPP